MILVAKVALDFGAVLLAHRLGREWLYATIVINLLLVSLVGAKLIEEFGFVTNDANVFYAAVFFATYLLLEHGKREDAIRAIGIGVGAVALFHILTGLSLMMQSLPETAGVSGMMDALYGVSLRIAIASLAGYIVAQLINIWLYTNWRERSDMHWWFSLACIIAIAQLADSIIFFFIAFWGEVPSRLLVESMIAGYGLKVIVGVASIPLIYASYYFRDEVHN